jgi:precorrin-2 C(20)-methyltransferase
MSAVETAVLLGIGVGPGDPEEMTLKAVRCIKSADVIAIPEKKESCQALRTAGQALPSVYGKHILELTIPMTRDPDVLDRAYKDAFAKLEPYLMEGKRVAFLTIGDVSIYSTYTKIGALAQQKGYKTAMVSGIPSFCASAAALNISLTAGSQELHILPGRRMKREQTRTAAKPVMNMADTIAMPMERRSTEETQSALSGTEIYMKSGKSLPALKAVLQERQKSEALDIQAVSNCGLPDELLAKSLEEIPESAEYMTTIIVRKKG